MSNLENETILSAAFSDDIIDKSSKWKDNESKHLPRQGNFNCHTGINEKTQSKTEDGFVCASSERDEDDISANYLLKNGLCILINNASVKSEDLRIFFDGKILDGKNFSTIKISQNRFVDGPDGLPTHRLQNAPRTRNISQLKPSETKPTSYEVNVYPAVMPDSPIEIPRIIEDDTGSREAIYNLKIPITNALNTESTGDTRAYDLISLLELDEREIRPFTDDSAKNPYCLVIININFVGIFAPRNGGQADLQNIYYLLKEVARFQKVDIKVDCTRTQILELMDTISSSEKINAHDGFVCFISSHGARKGIKTCDAGSYVTVDELTARLNGRKCLSLRGKPKLFFIQACRGMNKDRGVPHRGVDVDAAGDEITPKLPSSADFLICYSTIKGFLSYRRYSPEGTVEDPGSWFIKVLTEVFTKHMQKEDIMQMMTRVNFRVAEMATNGDHVDGMKMMPVEMYMLRKRLFFGNIPLQ